MPQDSTQCATRTVERVRDGQIIRINASDFDGEKHKEPGKTKRKPVRSAPRHLGTPAEVEKIG
jgi:hypothetical protein